MSIDIFRAKKNQTISKLFNGHLMYGILYRDNKIPISTLKKKLWSKEDRKLQD